jgi:hypothetical protein
VKKIFLLLFVCMLSMLAFAQSGSAGGALDPLSDGTSCAQLTPDRHNFGLTAARLPSAATPFFLRNDCPVPVVVTSVVTTGASYTQVNNCVGRSIAPNGYCAIAVTFTPLGAAIPAQQLIVTSHQQGSSEPMLQSSSLTGDHIPDVTMSPTSCNFGPVMVGYESQPCPVTLQNNSSQKVTIDSIKTTPDPPFYQSNLCPKSLEKKGQPGDHCVITVTCSPEEEGLYTGKLQVKTDAPDGSPSPDSLSCVGFYCPPEKCCSDGPCPPQ